MEHCVGLLYFFLSFVYDINYEIHNSYGHLLFFTMVRYGVISTPEVTDWQSLTNNDHYLVAASDGIFEKMTTKDVCDLLRNEKVTTNLKSDVKSSTSHSLADCLAEVAFRKGTVDNMAAIVVPLGSNDTSEYFVEDECDKEGASDLSLFVLQRALDRESGGHLTFSYNLL